MYMTLRENEVGSQSLAIGPLSGQSNCLVRKCTLPYRPFGTGFCGNQLRLVTLNVTVRLLPKALIDLSVSTVHLLLELLYYMPGTQRPMHSRAGRSSVTALRFVFRCVSWTVIFQRAAV